MKFLKSFITGFNGALLSSPFCIIFFSQLLRVSLSLGIHLPAANVLFIGFDALFITNIPYFDFLLLQYLYAI